MDGWINGGMNGGINGWMIAWMGGWIIYRSINRLWRSTFPQARAEDPDSGSFGAVRFGLSPSDAPFSIDGDTGVVTTTQQIRWADQHSAPTARSFAGLTLCSSTQDRNT